MAVATLSTIEDGRGRIATSKLADTLLTTNASGIDRHIVRTIKISPEIAATDGVGRNSSRIVVKEADSDSDSPIITIDGTAVENVNNDAANDSPRATYGNATAVADIDGADL
jgi:adenosine/AMP kinase